ncbi:hypothetical protein DFP73DRAFT_549027 [Morchella snyderi]|nr:hypothetical protein DFP73DRAFT_549027 [Morchella snyderi]
MGLPPPPAITHGRRFINNSTTTTYPSLYGYSRFLPYQFTTDMDNLKKWSSKLKGPQGSTPPRPVNPAYNFPPAPPPSDYPPDTKSSYGPSEYPPDNKSSHGPPPANTYTHAAPPFPPSGGGGSSSSAYPHDSEASDGAPPVYTPVYTPSATSTYTDDYKPPAFAPPSPTTTAAYLPPPPSISHEVSPAFNSTRALSDAGHRFTTRNPLFPPQQFPHALLSSIPTHPGGGAAAAAAPAPELAPAPRHFRGTIAAVKGGALVMASGTQDTCLVSAAPLFAAGYHHPANTCRARVFGYEVLVLALPAEAALVAVGFAAAPYPPFRLPGWNRGSLAVHSDDGRRYCNDDRGGRDFGAPFRAGERIGISMRFPVDTGGRGIEVFVTRDGKPAGGWGLHEEVDSRSAKNPAMGLDGSNDIYAAIGVWGNGMRVVVDNFYSREE